MAAFYAIQKEWEMAHQRQNLQLQEEQQRDQVVYQCPLLDFRWILGSRVTLHELHVCVWGRGDVMTVT